MVRRDFQEAKGGSSPVKDLWDIAVSDALRDDAIKLFEDYANLPKSNSPEHCKILLT